MPGGRSISRRTLAILVGAVPAAVAVEPAVQPPTRPRDSVAAEVAESMRKNAEAIASIAVSREIEPAFRFQA